MRTRTIASWYDFRRAVWRVFCIEDEKVTPDHIGQEGSRITNKRHNSIDCSQPPDHLNFFGGFFVTTRFSAQGPPTQNLCLVASSPNKYRKRQGGFVRLAKKFLLIVFGLMFSDCAVAALASKDYVDSKVPLATSDTAGLVKVDAELSTDSENTVQNSVVTTRLNQKQDVSGRIYEYDSTHQYQPEQYPNIDAAKQIAKQYFGIVPVGADKTQSAEIWIE